MMNRAAKILGVIAFAALLAAFSQNEIYDVSPQYGRLAFGSVTANSAGTANTVLTLSGKRRVIVCTNSLNTETILTYDGSNWIFLPANGGVAVDLGASGLSFVNNKVIGIYYLSAPASGSIACTAH